MRSPRKWPMWLMVRTCLFDTEPDKFYIVRTVEIPAKMEARITVGKVIRVTDRSWVVCRGCIISSSGSAGSIDERCCRALGQRVASGAQRKRPFLWPGRSRLVRGKRRVGRDREQAREQGEGSSRAVIGSLPFGGCDGPRSKSAVSGKPKIPTCGKRTLPTLLFEEGRR